MQAKLVTKIEANPLLSKHTNPNKLLRVAAYCRVSTDSEDQLESYKRRYPITQIKFQKIRNGDLLRFMRMRVLQAHWPRSVQTLCE